MKATTLLVLLQVIIFATLSIGSLSYFEISWAQPALGDPPCENNLEREERFLDRYEADPDNNGKQESFQSSFHGGPC